MIELPVRDPATCAKASPAATGAPPPAAPA
jgi:hypothetical protein